ncbi:MAG: CHASE3 domain-containing protein [Piscinibacter sp.]
MLESSRVVADRLRRSAFAFPLVALAALAMLVISELSYWRAGESLDELGQRAVARTTLQALARMMLDAESGQRGYLLTGRSEYLTPYREANEEIQSTLTTLRSHFGREPGQATLLADLEKHVQAKLSELQTSISLFDQGKHDSWRALVLTDIGREQMDAIRSLSLRLLDEESKAVARGRQDIYDTLMLTRIGIGALTALSVLALFMYLRQTAALDAQRIEQQRLIQLERDQLEHQVQRRTAQLRELARHLQTAREDERHRLARELHDELGALLTAAKLDVARLRSRLAPLAPELLERLNHLGQTLTSGIALKRRIIEDLRPSALANLGLVAALDILTREHAQRCGVELISSFDPGLVLSEEAELTAYRLVQEALTNVAKYAGAKQVEVRLQAVDGGARIVVADDGVGFDASQDQLASHGLFGMGYRVESVGGHLDVRSAPGQGTRIEAFLPSAAAPAA